MMNQTRARSVIKIVLAMTLLPVLSPLPADASRLKTISKIFKGSSTPPPRLPKPAPNLSTAKVVPPDPAVRVPSGDVRLPKSQTHNAAKGSYEPKHLRERLAAERVVLDPKAAGAKQLQMRQPMQDARWKHVDGWVKMQQKVDPQKLAIPYSEKLPGTTIARKPITTHYTYNKRTGAVDDVKIKGKPNLKRPTP